MDASKIKIKGIFNSSRRLEIPFYQRAYVWKEDQWERLLDDLELVSVTDKPYFIGSIILKAGKVNTWEEISDKKIVVDGQQRLTTILVFFKALCLLANMNEKFEKDFVLEDGELALTIGINDLEAFEKVTNATEAKEIEDAATESNIVKAFNFFINNIDVNKVDRLKIQRNIEFVCIDLDADEDEQQVFDTINSLGVKLTTAELLKNYFYSKDDVEEYQKNWVPVFEKDDETRKYWGQEFEAGSTKKTLINEFFDSYFKLFVNDSKYGVSAEDKIIYSRSDTLFYSYKDFIKNYCDGDMGVVLSNLPTYAKTFMTTFDPSWTAKAVQKEYGLERLNVIIFGLKTTTLIPYILFIQSSAMNEEKLKMYATLEKYIMRRTITRESTKNYNRMFTSFLTNKVLDNDKLIEELKSASQNTTSIPNDEELETAFDNSKLYNLQAKGVLYLIEASLRDHKDSTALLGFDSYSLEHLMPKKWRNEWAECKDEEKRDSVLLTLGNLAIITQSLNASIRDGNWTTKLNGKSEKPGLKACSSGLKTMGDVVNKVAWNEDEISERSDWLKEKAKAIWTI